MESMKPPQGLLSRGLTFDDRIARPPASVIKTDFLYPRKAKSFGHASSKASRSRSNSHVEYQDVLYRRHFGKEDLGDVHPVMATHIKMELPHVAPPAKLDLPQSVVVVDTFSTGAWLAYYLHNAGYKVIGVMSADLSDLLEMVPEGLDFSFAATFTLDTSIDTEVAVTTLLEQVESTGFPTIAVMAGAETGVELADLLSERMGLRTNGSAMSEARRNKYVMGETIRQAGIRAVRQIRASKWGEIAEFLSGWNPDPFKIIVKPVDSAGSDGVTLCLSYEEVLNAYENLVGKVNGLGIVNTAVLVQEYLEGQEYVVDAVSRDGEHKVVAVWAYDRRPVNGAGFVCFGQRLLTVEDDPCVTQIIEYQKKVITALGIRNGPTHGEVKWFKGEPVLVEVGARCHGAEGSWVALTHQVYGYNQVEVSIDSYLDQDAFDAVPPIPIAREGFARLCFLISRNSSLFGRIYRDFDADFAKELDSNEAILDYEIFLKPGSVVKPTMDCFGFAGFIKIFHTELGKVEAAYDRLRAMEELVIYSTEKA